MNVVASFHTASRVIAEVKENNGATWLSFSDDDIGLGLSRVDVFGTLDDLEVFAGCVAAAVTKARAQHQVEKLDV